MCAGTDEAKRQKRETHEGASKMHNDQEHRQKAQSMTTRERLREMSKLTAELEACARLAAMGHQRRDIKARRLLQTTYENGRWNFCNKNCQVLTHDGRELVLPIELIFTPMHPMSEKEMQNHRFTEAQRDQEQTRQREVLAR